MIRRYLLFLAIFFVSGGIHFTSAQDASQVATTIQQAVDACADAGLDQACFGAGAVKTDGSESLNAAGDVVSLEGLRVLQTAADNWGISLAHLSVEADSADALTMVLLGDAEVTNNYDPANKTPTCTITNLNAGGLNVHIGPDADLNVIDILDSQEKVTASGRTDASDWYRVQIGEQLGWVESENAAIDCEASTLNVVSVDDVSVLYEAPMQQITLVTGGSSDAEKVSGLLLASPINVAGRLLVNNVQLEISGAAFLTASGDSLHITGLLGSVDVNALGEGVTLRYGQSTDIALADNRPANVPTPPAAADTGNLPDLLNSLVNGQPYAGAGSTASGLEIAGARQTTPDGELVRVDVAFSGDAAVCGVQDVPPSDVVLAVDVASGWTDTEDSLVRAALANFMNSFTRPTDRLGLVLFRRSGFVVSTLGTALTPGDFERTFNSTVNDINTQETGIEGSFTAGLSSASGLYKKATPSKGSRSIVLVTDGTSNGESLLTTAEELRNQGIVIYAVGVGAEANTQLLTAIAGDADNVVSIDSLFDLGSAFDALSGKLSRSIGATDFELTYTYDPAVFEVDDSLLDSADVVNPGTVQIAHSVIYDRQIVKVPLALKAGAVPDSAGSVSLRYTCGDGSQISADSIEVPIGKKTQTGILKIGDTGKGILKAFDRQQWLVDTGDNSLVSVITEELKSSPVALIDGLETTPIYTLDNFDGSGATLYIFSVAQGGLHWLTLQSPDTTAAGSYAVRLDTDTFDAAVASLSPGGEIIEDQQVNSEGRIYTLDGVQPGDVVTFRYTGDLGALREIGALSLDGTATQTKIARFEDRNDQYVLVEQIAGEGPYRAIVKTDGDYALEVIAGDDLTDDRGTLRLNDTLNQNVVNDNPVLVSYSLDVAQDSDLAVVLSGRAGTPFVRNADNDRLEALESVNTNGFDLTRFHFVPGAYTIYMQVIGSYDITVVPVFGDLTDSLGDFKGSVLLENAVESDSSSESRFPIAVYNLSAGTGKPLVDGDAVTIFLERSNDASDDSVSIHSADGLVSVVQSSNSLPRQRLYIGVHELRGIAPYRVIVNGLESYRFNITRGDHLSNDKGSIVVGTSLSDSSASPELLTYEISPELGKKLVEGDTVTIAFRNRGDEDDPFNIPTVTDGKENPIAPGRTFSVGRLYLGVYELRGTAPYRIVIPNIGAYTLGVDIGDTLVSDQGELELAADDPITGTTDGPQIVEYQIKIEQERTFTISITDTNRDGFRGSELNAQIRKAENDEFIADNVSLSTGQTIKRVYTLQPGEYILSFTIEGTFSIESKDGDDLTVDKGVFYLGDAEVVQFKPEDRDKVLKYRLNITDPQTLTVRVSGASWQLIAPDGATVLNRTDLFTYDDSRRYTGQANVFDLADTGEYQLLLFASGNFVMEVKTHDTLTVDKGNAYFGILETDKLQRNERYATYTVNAKTGDTVSVALTIDRIRRDRSFLDETTLGLTDANGDPISTVWRVTDLGYNLFVYELTGPAPYTLHVQPQRLGDFSSAFDAQEEYQLIVLRGDAARIPLGNLLIGSSLEGEIKAEGGTRTLQYTIANGTPGDITVNFTPDRQTDAVNVRLYSPADERIIPEVYTLVRNRTGRYSFHLADTGNYRLEFEVLGKYTLEALAGDIQTAEFGKLQLNPENPPVQTETNARGETVEVPYEPIIVSNNLSGDQVVARYTFDKPAATNIVSVQVDGRLGSDLVVMDDQNRFAFLLDRVTQGNNNIGVYLLDTPGTYSLRFRGSAGHKVQLDEGNVLIADLGALPLNPANPPATKIDETGKEVEYEPTLIETELEDPAIVASYILEGKPGDIVTVQLEQSGNTPLAPFVFNGSFEIIPFKDSIADGGSLVETYQLAGLPPYTMRFAVGGKYTIGLYEGDQLSSFVGTLEIGQLAEPYTNELEGIHRIAEHTVNLPAGSIITVQVQNNRNQLTCQVVDADGNVLIPELSYFLNSQNNVTVYLLSGKAPYTLRIPTLGEYEVSVVDSNLVRRDLGFIAFAQDIEGELEDPGVVAIYALDGKRDQFATVALQDSNRPALAELRDANGKRWEADQLFVQNNILYSVYKLGGPPPYEIIFSSDRDYNISVADGNVLEANLGAAKFGEEVSSELEDPATTAVYTIPANPGEEVSVQLQVGNRPALFQVYNGAGQLLPADKELVKQNASFGIYTLAGEAPYTLKFDADRPFKVTVSQGNVLIAHPDDLVMNEDVRGSLDFPAEQAVYTIQRSPGAVISVALQDGSRPGTPELRDADDNVLEPDAEITKNNRNYRVYTLSGSAPYDLQFVTGGRYTMNVSDGNVLRADKGVLRFGNQATDQLVQPQEAAIYIIDAVPGQVISVTLQDRSNRDGELRDADGNVVLPFNKAALNNRRFTAYDLTGQGPYTFTFFPQGRYTVGLEDGNIFRSDQGSIPFGSSASMRLQAPARIAVYHIYTTSDQIISLTVADRGREYVIPNLYNAEGEKIEPFAQIYDGTSTYSGVYMLQGSAPFTVDFETINQYTFTMKRGNITEIEAEDIGPVAPTQQAELITSEAVEKK